MAKWYVVHGFTIIHEADSKADALFWAQGTGTTDARPKKISEGNYELTGSSGNVYSIISESKTKAHFKKNPDTDMWLHSKVMNLAQTERRFSRGAADYYHSAKQPNKEELHKRFTQEIEPLYLKHGEPEEGTAEWHNFQKELIKEWRETKNPNPKRSGLLQDIFKPAPSPHIKN